MKNNIILLCKKCDWIYEEVNTYIKNECPRCRKKGLDFISFTTQDVVELIENKKELEEVLEEIKSWENNWDWLRV